MSRPALSSRIRQTSFTCAPDATVTSPRAWATWSRCLSTHPTFADTGTEVAGTIAKTENVAASWIQIDLGEEPKNDRNRYEELGHDDHRHR